MELTKLTPQVPNLVDRVPGQVTLETRENSRRGCFLLLGTIIILVIIVIIGLLLISSSTANINAAPKTSLLRISTIDLADITAADAKLAATFAKAIVTANPGSNVIPELFASTVKALIPGISQPNTTLAYSLDFKSQDDSKTTELNIQGTLDERGTQGSGRIYNERAIPSAEFDYIYVQPLLYVKLTKLVDTQTDQAKVMSHFLDKWVVSDLSKYGNLADQVEGLPKIANASFTNVTAQELITNPLLTNPQIGSTAKIDNQNVSCIVYEFNPQALHSTLSSFELPSLEICSAEKGQTPLRFKFAGKYKTTQTEFALAIEGLSLNPLPISPPTENLVPLNEIIAPV